MPDRLNRCPSDHWGHRHWSALVGTVITVTAFLLLPTSAAAERLEVLDGRRDYWHDHRADGDTPDQHPTGLGQNPDIRRTVYRHWHHRVSVRIKMARIDLGGYWEIEVRMRTNERVRGIATWFKPSQGTPITTWPGPGSCSIDGRIDYDRDAFVIDVPRRCLSRPTRVAFKSATRRWITSDDVAYLDVSGQPGYRLSHWSAPVARG
jgi:hypothetical protein